MAPRLNRKRYRECVIALKAIIADPKTPAARRLRAVETLILIYDKSDRQAAKRATTQRRGSDGQGQPTEAIEAPEGQEAEPESVDAFLQRIHANQEDDDE